MRPYTKNTGLRMDASGCIEVSLQHSFCSELQTSCEREFSAESLLDPSGLSLLISSRRSCLRPQISSIIHHSIEPVLL